MEQKLSISEFKIKLSSLIEKDSCKLPDELKSEYRLVLKKEELRSKRNNIILDLVDSYEIGGLSFGDFSMENEIKEINNVLFAFATSSYSFLGVSKDYVQDDEIYEYDRLSYEPMRPVASNSENFLEAVLLYIEMLSLRFGIKGPNREVLNSTYLKRCITAAGGDEYSDFYKILITGRL